MTDSPLGSGLFAVLMLSFACESPAPRLPFPIVDAWHEPPAAGRRRVDEPSDDEKMLWSEASQTIEALEKNGDLVDDEILRNFAQTLVDRIAPLVHDGGPEFHAIVLADSARNAAALPDGHLLLTLGMVAAFEDEAEFAMVLGHEIAHVLLRHSLIRSRYDARTASYVDRMSLSRELERRADELGLRLVTAAGYSAASSIRALDRLDHHAPETTSLVRSWESHEDLHFRRNDLVREASRIEERPRQGDSESFERVSRSIRLRAAELALAHDRVPDARSLIERHLADDPMSGRAYYLRGEVMRRLQPEVYLHAALQRDYERAVEYSPRDADAVRALGLLHLDAGRTERALPLLRLYLDLRPDAIDRKIIERYLAPPAG